MKEREEKKENYDKFKKKLEETIKKEQEIIGKKLEEEKKKEQEIYEKNIYEKNQEIYRKENGDIIGKSFNFVLKNFFR